MNKYDWSKVPSEVNWIATDEDGWAYGFGKQPKLRESRGFWSPLEFQFSIPEDQNKYKGEWKDSLEQRPEEQSQ